MTDPAEPRHDPRQEPPSLALGYERPTAGLSKGWQMSLGCLVAAAAVVLVGLVGGLAADAAGAIAALVVVVVLLALVAVSLRRSPRTAGWAAGIWIGLAVSVLLEGICWTALG